MINRSRTAVLFMAILFVAGILISNPCWAAPSIGSLAPENPRYLEYLEMRQNIGVSTNEKAPGEPGNAEFSLGYIPSPLDMSHIFKKYSFPAGLKASANYPRSYDLRDHEKITGVKDQGPFGTCWTFSTFASIESYLKPEKSSSFSEYHLAYSAYSGPDSFTSYVDSDDHILNNGGNCYKATALLSRWEGPFYAEDCPYDTKGNPPGMGAESSVRGHLQNVFMLSSPEQIKDAIMNRGSVPTSFCVDRGRFTEDQGAYYFPPDNPDIPKNIAGWHAVAIAGWDDDYDKENFAIEDLADSTPPGNGAWLIKNSWGTDWGYEGYFWISYYDSEICEFFSFEIEPADNFRNIYQYDPLGWISTYSVADYTAEDDTAWFANVFSFRQTELLKAVSFYAGVEKSEYEISIYEEIGGNLIYGPQEGILSDAGYHTLLLKEPVLFEKGEDLAVAVKLTTPGYEYPIPVELAWKGYSDNATALPGQSFVSRDGNDWIDATELDPTMNVCLKAFTGPLAIDISGLNDSIYTDLTGTPSAEFALENAREVINKTDPASFGVSAEHFNLLDLMDYRSISGNLESAQMDIKIASAFEISQGKNTGKKYILLLAWNYEMSQFDVLHAEGAEGSSPSSVPSAILIKDGGVYDFPRVENGKLSNVNVMQVLAEAKPSQNNSSSGGGCSLGLTGPAALLMLAPLLLFKKR